MIPTQNVENLSDFLSNLVNKTGAAMSKMLQCAGSRYVDRNSFKYSVGGWGGGKWGAYERYTMSYLRFTLLLFVCFFYSSLMFPYFEEFAHSNVFFVLCFFFMFLQLL